MFLVKSAAGMDLRRIRNQRGLKASQLARLAGHDGLAALLSERQGGARSRARASRRRRRNREALHTQGGGPRPVSSPEAVLALLVQVSIVFRMSPPVVPRESMEESLHTLREQGAAAQISMELVVTGRLVLCSSEQFDL